ncbi:MAG: hypothetical protein RR420_00905 [Anaerovoracaceae bacterium]
MKYQNIHVLNVSPVIYLGDKSKNWKSNQEYVRSELEKVKDKIDSCWEIECPIGDMVLIYLPIKDNLSKEDYETMTTEDFLLEAYKIATDFSDVLAAYEILNSIFEDVKINLYLDDVIEGIGNNVDMSIDEFKSFISRQQCVQNKK